MAITINSIFVRTNNANTPTGNATGMYCTVENGYKNHFGAKKSDSYIRLILISAR